MRKIVIMPGGFHPFHAGHAALYKSAVEAFNDADVYVAATNDTKTRPFPFAIKEKLAKLAGVADKHFVQVKSPFQPKEITDHYNPAEDVVIFVRSEKDKNESPKPGGTKKDGTPAYFQPWTGKDVQPFGKHAYIAYLPTVEFGPGITSATEIRNAWPTLNDKRKTAMVMSLYPVTQKNPKLAANVVKMLDMGMGNELAEGEVIPFKQPSKTLTWQQVPKDILLLANDWFWASEDNSGLAATIDPEGFGNGTANDVKYNAAKLQQKGWTIDFNDEYDGPGEFNLRLTNKRGQTVLLSIEDAQSFTGWAKGTSQYDLEEGPIVKRIVHPNKINIYIRTGNNKPPLLVASDIPYQIFDKYVTKAIQKYPQFKKTDFSFKSSDKIKEETNLSESADYLDEN
jgi:glycerol-3-phosphate cytidylyltransferase-like family protein